jgi:hypothetical protein
VRFSWQGGSALPCRESKTRIPCSKRDDETSSSEKSGEHTFFVISPVHAGIYFFIKHHTGLTKTEIFILHIEKIKM